MRENNQRLALMIIDYKNNNNIVNIYRRKIYSFYTLNPEYMKFVL